MRSSRLARAYFILQAVVGAIWWVAVFRIESLRRATLGDADPRAWIIPDVLLFVVPSLWMARLPEGSRGSRLALSVLVAWSIAMLGWFGWKSLDGGRGAWGVIAMAFAATGTVISGLRLAVGPTAAGRCFPSPLRIRPAGDASTHRHLFATSIQIVFFWGFFLGLLPWIIDGLEDRWKLRMAALSGRAVALAGWVLFATQTGLGLRAAVEMVTRGRGTPLPSAAANRLVTTGPYALVRNPMAVAGILQGVAVGLVFGSWLVIAYALTGSIVWNTMARPYEEAELASRFGPEFEAYRRRVPCWIPRPAR